MYKIIYDSAKYSVEEAMALFDGRSDIYFIEPAYADNIKLYAHSYLSYMAAPPSWYWSYVIYAVENGIMNGFAADYDPYSDGAYHESFRPNDVLTRAQLAQIFYNVYGNGERPKESVYDYDDIYSDVWYYDAICWAIDNGIMNGVGDRLMAPNEPVTREMFVTILYRAAKTIGLSTVNNVTEDISDITDLDTVSEWADEAAMWATEGGLMSGTKIGDDMMWLPQDTCTRAQAAKVFTLFHNYHSAYAPESGMTEAEFYDMLHNR